MNNKNEVIKKYNEKHPAFGSHMECMSRALLTGLSSFSISFGAVYFSQHLLSKHLPYGIKGTIALSSLVSVAVSYRVTILRTKSCQAAWLAAKDKHTCLNPLSERNIFSKEPSSSF